MEAHNDEIAALSSAVWNYSGKFKWALLSDFPNLCVTATALRVPDTVEQFLADAEELAQYLESRFKGSERHSVEYTSPLVHKSDRSDPGAFSVYLVSNPKVFMETHLPTSDRDLALHFSPTTDEIETLLFELRKDPFAPPMLSRFGDRSAVLSLSELPQVQQYLAAAESTAAPSSANILRKLSDLVDAAAEERLALVLIGD